jgi:uncharacterized RDD family membrane protein YckC
MISDEARAQIADQAAPGERPAPGGKAGTEVQYAGLWRRLAAGLIDAFLIPAVYYLASFIMGFFFGAASNGVEMSGDNASLTRYAAWIAGFVVWWLYCILMERSGAQGTLGKVLLGIGVTDAGGRRISLGRAIARNLAKIVSGAMLLTGCIMIAFTGKKQGLHDILAGCLVVVKK